MSFGEGEAAFEGKPLITLAEPCCGAGRLVLAFASVVKAAGFNPQRRLWIEATDVDRVCQQMTFIQMSLCGLAGTVTHGNSLTRETWERAMTPCGVYLLTTNREAREAVKQLHTPHTPPPPPPPPPRTDAEIRQLVGKLF